MKVGTTVIIKKNGLEKTSKTQGIADNMISMQGNKYKIQNITENAYNLAGYWFDKNDVYSDLPDIPLPNPEYFNINNLNR